MKEYCNLSSYISRTANVNNYNIKQIKNIIDAWSIDDPEIYREIADEHLSALQTDDYNKLITSKNNEDAQYVANKLADSIFGGPTFQRVLEQVRNDLYENCESPQLRQIYANNFYEVYA